MKLWPSAEGVRRAHLGTLFGASACVILLVWLPIVTIQLLDTLTPFMTVVEVLDFLALNVLVLVCLSWLLALLARLTGGLLNRLHSRHASLVAWLLALAPVGVLAFWKLGSAVKSWFELTLGLAFNISGTQKAALVVTITALLLFSVHRWSKRHPQRLFEALTKTLTRSFPLAVALTAFAAAWLAWRPPALNWAQQTPVAQENYRGTLDRRERPNIILISIDSLSAADADPCGQASGLMPHLQKLAAQSSCFLQFYASSNYTIPTTSTIESGLLPWTHWAVNFNSSLPSIYRDHSLPASLQAIGYETHSVSANQWASPRQHGTWRNYDLHNIPPSASWNYSFAAKLTEAFPDSNLPLLGLAIFPFLLSTDIHFRGNDNPWNSDDVYLRGGEVMSRQVSDGNTKPVFLWLHTMPPHSPYLAPESTRYRLLPKGQLDRWRDFLPDNIDYPPSEQSLVNAHQQRYRESVMAADASVGRFLHELETTGEFDRSLIIVTADHGESFEKGFLGHSGKRLHNALIRIPLLVKLPGQTTPRIIAAPFSQADLTPTMIAFVRAKPQVPMDGRSMLPVLRGEPQQSVPVFSMSLERESRFRPIRRGQFVMIDGQLKLTFDLGSEVATLHNLVDDPQELVNIATKHPDDVSRMKRELRRRIEIADALRSQHFGR